MEHLTVARLLKVTSRVVERLVRSGELPDGDLDATLSLIHRFVDHFHHAREEFLQRALVAAGLRQDEGILQVIGADHDRLRSLISAARASAPGAIQGDTQAIATLAHVTREYVNLTKEHLEREEGDLLCRADELLDAESARRLEEDLEDDLRSRPAGSVEAMARELTRLEAAYDLAGGSAG